MDQNVCRHSRTDMPKKGTEKLVYQTTTLVCFVREVAAVVVVVVVVVVVLIVVADMLASFGRTVATGLRPKEATFHGIAGPS